MSESSVSEQYPTLSILILTLLLLLVSVRGAAVSAKTDKEVLVELKLFLQSNNKVNQGRYAKWNESDLSPCRWPGIVCSSLGRVTGVYLNDSSISGPMFPNFSQLAALTHLDMSSNTVQGLLPPDLNRCAGLRYLNLSHNTISGTLNLTALTRLETLDLTVNRFEGGIRANFPAMCRSLVTLNVSLNSFVGEIGDMFDSCQSLRYLDLSSNQFSGGVWRGMQRLQEVSVSQNNLAGTVTPETFTSECNLQILDLSENGLTGAFPNSISHCSKLNELNLWGNNFSGAIPSTVGLLPELTTLFLGNNSFDRAIPEQIVNCSKLEFVDLSRNNFGQEVQEIFGRITTLRFLVLHSNSYTSGIESSRILDLPNLVRLDLSFNNFTGNLPIRISGMRSLKVLILAYNGFVGSVPSAYGDMIQLQALDLSYNRLSGTIPPSIGKLRNLLWLMLAENRLVGEIPTEIGNCTSLLWLNLENNLLSGSIPSTISAVGTDPEATFEVNRADPGSFSGSGECLTMRRWIPASYPPFKFVYMLMTRKSCREIWADLLKGLGVFPICRSPSSPVRTLAISGYLQLSGNRLSGEIPPEIGRMRNLSLLHVDRNVLSGELPAIVANLPLIVLNASNNRFSGGIPPAIGTMRCLQSLDLSSNNFSGELPASLDRLSDLNIFNVSYNPLLSGEVPITGQIATFGNDSFIGDPLISVPAGNRGRTPPPAASVRRRPRARAGAFLTFLTLTAIFFAVGFLPLLAFLLMRSRVGPDPEPAFPDDDVKRRGSDDAGESPSSSESSGVKLFRLGRTAFTHADIVRATGNFSDASLIGRGGCGAVYRGVLRDGRRVAVKKLERMGSEGEREFRAEMEILTGSSAAAGWPHPNLVELHGWCLAGPEKLLVYDFMEGGSVEEVVTEWARFGWARRVEVAVGVARALAFLHHACRPAVVHRDVKASNVLLDRGGRARVTDFGLARVVGPGESHVSTVVAGTVGYVAPEYGHTGRATTKGDVYSFGVLVMELATGRRALDLAGDGGREECLVEWARRVGAKEAVRSAVGAATEGMLEMLGLMSVGMWCTTESPQMRPDMKEVLAVLLPLSRGTNCSSSSSSSGGGNSNNSSGEYTADYFSPN